LRISRTFVALATTATILFTACSSAATTAPTAAPATPAPATAAPATPAPATAAPATAAPASAAAMTPLNLGCIVTDTGGINDKGFNADAWKGMQDAQAAGYVKTVKFLESKAATDYPRNLDAFINQKCDIITTVGFLLGDDTKKSATANPNQKYSIVDYAYDPTLPNVLGLVYQTEQGAMLACYVGAGMTKTGKIGTYGGIQLPTVTPFMDGCAAGINYYNKENGKNVKLLGWTPGTAMGKGNGLFVGDFTSTQKAATNTQSLIQEGADIILPVAGGLGLATAKVAQQNPGVMVIGVDTDQYVTAPEYKSTYLTSILKLIAPAVEASVKEVADGSFKGGTYVATLANNGLGLAPFHEFDSKVPASLKSGVDALKAKIVSGEVTVDKYLNP